MAPQDPQSAALLAHVIAQVESNVQFLAAQNYISQADASAMLSKLPNTNNNSVAPLAARMNNVAISTPAAPPTPQRAPSMPAPETTFQARAIWAYNEDNRPRRPLLSAGDIIEIVDETNQDWWTGRINGKQALFPANYVERLPPAAAPARTLPPMSHGSAAPAPAHAGGSEKPVYRPFGAAYHGSQSTAPPPPGQGVNNVGLQEDPGQEKKKSKYGKFGNTMAHSAAGGVGFGAGAAIGGGLVRAIF
ncbi:hypothetical protein BD779DRAFT_1668288 [Infundibulicybe gibba]|nr:hypothetical protein BD779DRAFT_1668288 [Infundibulicybe gibba]